MEAHGLVTRETTHHATWPLARHFLEMVAAMWVGMVVGGLIFAPILGALGMTPSEARVRYPELYLCVMAFNMTVPMVLWMRYRGHGWRSCFEMSAAMVLPGVFVLCLFWIGVTDGPACGLYCGLMIPAMLAFVLFRRAEYSQSHRAHVEGGPSPAGTGRWSLRDGKGLPSDSKGVERMFTFKNVMAIGLFLFGTTFMWMTASFAGRTPPPDGAVWTVENILALVAVVGFAAAGWGVFKELSWWEPVAVASAIVGLIAVVPYILGLIQIDVDFADAGVQINLATHVVGSAVVLALVLVPAVHEWFTARLS